MNRQSPIIERLTQMRRTARRRLLLFGVFAVLAGGIAAFFTIVLIDWMVWLPPALRVLAGVLFILGFVGSTYHWVWEPLRATISLDELAGKVERHFPPLKDRLASSVNFLQRGDVETSAMAQHVVVETEAAIDRIPLEAALVGGPVKRRAMALIAMTAVLVIVWSAAPGWMILGAKRYMSPWAKSQWPRTVQLAALDGDQVVPMGDAATVNVRIDRGWRESLRPVVHVREADGPTNTIALRHDGGQQYSATIDSVTRELTYWFEAGDDDTADAPSIIRVVRRPEIMEARAVIEPPPYAENTPSRAVDLRDETAPGIVGGFVTVHLRASKPVKNEAGYTAGLLTEEGHWIPLATDETDSSLLSARWQIDQDLHFKPVVRDEFGFENRAPSTYSLQATPDAPPTVTVLEPPPITEVTAAGTVRLVVRAEDDLGVEQLHLTIEQPNGESVLINFESVIRSGASDSTAQALGTMVWNLASLALAPGDVVSCQATALDNYRDDQFAGQQSVSPPLRIKVISDGEFELRVREDLAALEDRLRRTSFDQAGLHDDTAALQSAARTTQQLSDAQKDAAASLSVAQLRLARQVRDISSRFSDITKRVEQNLPQSPEKDRIAQLGETLRDLAGGPMSSASALLGRTRDPLDHAKNQAFLEEAEKAQQIAITGLKDVLRAMGQWGAFQGVVSRTQDLLERQNQLRLQTAELGKVTLGKPIDSLSPDELLALRDQQRRQEHLLDDIVEHVNRLEQMHQTLAEKDPTAAQAVDAAIRAARAEDLVRHARQAAQAISENRSGAAQNEQRAAADALKKMLGSLYERQTRELAQLRKELGDAARHVEELIEQQNEVLVQTRSLDAPAESELEDFATRQRTVARNARFLGDDLSEAEATSDAGLLVRQSSTPMTDAENELINAETAEAIKLQEQALHILEEARQLLLSAQEEAAQEMLRRTLEEIHEDLQNVLVAQKAINGGLTDVQKTIKSSQRLGRAEIREVARLAKDQSEARKMVSELLPDMEQVAVYRWALERVARWMDEIRESLEARRVEDQTLVTATRIQHDLENLLAALIQTQSMPLDTEFEEAGEGGSGSSDDSASPNLPTMTELLVLKTMQDDINTRTAAIYARFDPQNAAEHVLRELRVLGEDQTQVQALAQLVTQRANRR